MILAGNVALESMGFKTFGFGGGCSAVHQRSPCNNQNDSLRVGSVRDGRCLSSAKTGSGVSVVRNNSRRGYVSVRHLRRDSSFRTIDWGRALLCSRSRCWVDCIMNIRGRRALPEDGKSDKFDATRIIAEDSCRIPTHLRLSYMLASNNAHALATADTC
jgi:hypothetical protein